VTRVDERSSNDALRRRKEELEKEVEELLRNLSEERAASRALEAGQVDAVVDRSGGGALLLQAAQAALRASEERYRVLFDESPMPMWAYDPESLRIVMVNQAAAEQYGYTTDELLALAISDVRPSEDAEKIRAAVRAQPRGRLYAGIRKHRRKDGSYLDVDVHLNEVRLGGRTLRLAVLHDVTQRRSLEEQLRQSQKMEAVGRLAGGVAHDFNNLLTVILGYSDLLANRFRAGDPEGAEIQEIRRAGERAATLTRQLLAFSRKQVLVPEALDLGSVVRGVSGMLERLIGEDITVSLAVARDLGRVLADPGQMEQVVMNLAVNARDAMPQGGKLLLELENVDLGEAYVSEHLGATPGPYVLLTVTDTGVGMAPEVQREIFEPFFTTKPKGVGTGLGLSTVHGIVNQSGGTIWVYSEPGRGTTFKIYLPRIPGGAAAPRKPSGPHRAVEGSATVLLVEDEEQLRHLTKRVLERSLYTVLEAGNAPDALRVAREHKGPIHLLLTDVVMPGMSGPELAASFERERPGVPVLYMSGYTDNAIVHHGILNSGTHFLQKPFTPQGLTQRVHEVMSGTR
jgi:two-component system cell cycle sensor histidine kinase/response regulator CckA